MSKDNPTTIQWQKYKINHYYQYKQRNKSKNNV